MRLLWILTTFAAATLSGSGLAAGEFDLPGWDLVWRDEFDGDSVDASRWERITEPSWFEGDVHHYLPEQASVSGGALHVTATDQPIGHDLYRSARLESWLAFGPGRFEARIDLPTGKGMAPAFWLYPNDPATPWPTGGEIDIVENLGDGPHFTLSAYHWQSEPGPCCDLIDSVFDVHAPTIDGQPADFHDGYHTFAAEWDADQIRYYVDGQLHFTVTETESRPIFDTPKNVILNLAVGGAFAGYPDGSTQFPQTMSVDYVRVWTRSSGLTPGDYNADGRVDAGDYTTWRDGARLANDPTPGDVTRADYELWAQRYGATAATPAAVPEPAALLLGGVLVAALNCPGSLTRG